jgi:hypothetical protein
MAKVVTEPAFLMVQMVVRGQKTPPKKVLKPKTLAVLLKQVNAAFKTEKPIRSFVNEDGTVIKTLDDLESGSVIIASLRAHKENEEGLTFQEIEDMEFIGLKQGKASTVSSNSRGRSRGVTDKVSFANAGRPRRVEPLDSAMRDSHSHMDSRSHRDSRYGSVGGADSRRRLGLGKAPEFLSTLSNFISDENILTALENQTEKRDFIAKLAPIEKQQSVAWHKAVLGQPVLAYLTEGVTVYETVKRQAADAITNHRFLSGKSVEHRMRIAVIGPRYSGKSTLLGELVAQLVTEMVFTGEWKSSFVFALDVLQFLPFINDYPKLLEVMVTEVLNAVVGQRPVLLESLQQLKRKLNAAVKFGTVEPTPSTRTAFDAIAKRLSELWRQKEAFPQFMSAIFQLPLQVAKAAGIPRIILVVDNIDRADVQLMPADPFAPNSGFMFLSELLKYILEESNFVIACEDTEQLFGMMPRTDDEGIDLTDRIEFIATVDVADEAGHDHDHEGERFAVQVEGDDLPLQLHIGLCGGIVHFLTKWKELCRLMSGLDACKQGTEFGELQFAALHCAQQFVSLVFIPDEPKDEIHVVEVSRLPDAESL